MSLTPFPSDALPSSRIWMKDHQPIEFNVKDNPDHLKWLHTMISNAKAFIGGTFHGLAPKHLQSYLDEFCFRTKPSAV
jgi:hypothetical protein